MFLYPSFSFFFFFNDTATTEIYTLSLHDALPILHSFISQTDRGSTTFAFSRVAGAYGAAFVASAWLPEREAHFSRSEEHTSELQSHLNLVCRLLLEKKKNVDYLTFRPPLFSCALS